MLVLKNRYDQYSYDPPTPKNTIVDWLNGQMSNEIDEDGDSVGHDHDPDAPGRGGQIKASHIINEPNGGLASTRVQGAINELKGLVDLGRIHVPVRQTVLQGKFNYSERRPIFISEVPGQLKLNLWATEVPLICTICDGFDIYGQKDYVFAFTQDIPEAWTLPSNKSFLQLYIEYNPTTKTATFGYTEVLSVWDYPSAPTIDMHWIDKDNLWIVQQWNGTAWEKKYRLMVGECTTDASSVTSVICYAIQGKYESERISIGLNNTYVINANIGSTATTYRYEISQNSDGSGWNIDTATSWYMGGLYWKGAGVVYKDRNIIKFRTADTNIANFRDENGTEIQIVNGYLKIKGQRDF